MIIHTFLDLCSGIGGGRLALEKLGMQSIGYSDTSKLAVKTYHLMHNAENEPYYYNLKNIKTEKIEPYDMLIAGFPCQSFSVIGRRDGFSDNKGQIIFHIVRLLKETKPKCFLLENVKGLVTHDKEKTIKIIIKELNDAGYNVVYKVLTSLEYGVPQMRQRVYFVGIRKDICSDLEEFQWPIPVKKPSLKNYLIDNNMASKERLEILSCYLNNETNQGKYSINDICKMEGKIIDTRMNDLRIYEERCPTLRAQRDGILYVKNHKIYQLTGYEALLLQGFPKEYADKVKDKVSDRHLLMQAGNAMTVNVIQKIGQCIQKFLSNKEKKNMEKWEEFEVECTNYLNGRFNDYAEFTLQGGANSRVSDILVQTKTGKNFYVEAKHSPAQCGQFVLLPNLNDSTFEYSERNVNRINDCVNMIINYMNQNFDEYREAGTAGKEIDMPNGSEIFSDWIIQTYRNKGTEFFITNNFTLVPIDDFMDYFDVTAKYRIKRSGSSNIGKSRMSDIINQISEHDYIITDHNVLGDKLFVWSPSNLNKKKFIFNGNEYMYSLREDKYELRKLSNTYNANVIFSIKRKNQRLGISDEDFKDYLK